MHVEAEIKALIKIKISKSKLYEAKVGVIEMQKRWDQPRSGMVYTLNLPLQGIPTSNFFFLHRDSSATSV
jgi:hypothetical protein